MSIKIENIGPLIDKIVKENDIQSIADAREALEDMFKNIGPLISKDEK